MWLVSYKNLNDIKGKQCKINKTLQFTRTFCKQISCLHENLLAKGYEGSATL